jgi:hypothetical protein
LSKEVLIFGLAGALTNAIAGLPHRGPVTILWRSHFIGRPFALDFGSSYLRERPLGTDL